MKWKLEAIMIDIRSVDISRLRLRNGHSVLAIFDNKNEKDEYSKILSVIMKADGRMYSIYTSIHGKFDADVNDPWDILIVK
jgi:hypothetical protein